MPLLPCKGYVQPVLSILRGEENGLAGSELTEYVASCTHLTEEERKESITDGTPKYVVRIKQARYWLKNQQFVKVLDSGNWAITALGIQFLAQTGGTHPKLARPATKKSSLSSPERTIIDEEIEEAPLEKLDQALTQITEALKHELVQHLIRASPRFFERSVLELMRAMGYAGNRGAVKHTGGVGDGGIDGILYFDRLGLERVYVQAKRWQKPVGGPEMQQFCGALSVNRAQKGVLITTATFTNAAHGCASKAPQVIRLIGGNELAGLMIEFGVGVSRTKTMIIPEIDRDFFEDA